jgi:hypothetical protein
MEAILARLLALPPGHSEGLFQGRRWGITRTSSPDGRRHWLFAEELGGPARVSCNLYRLGPVRLALRPCEMPEEDVVAFLLGVQPAS